MGGGFGSAMGGAASQIGSSLFNARGMDLSGGGTMPLSQIDPRMLNPQERYAFYQALAQQQIGRKDPGSQALSPQAQLWQQAIMSKFFPNLGK